MWLYQWAEARNRKPPKDGEQADDWLNEDDLPDVVALGYPLDTALGLWNAWNRFGIMPHGGGYLDQPRKWRRLILLLDDRAAKIERAYRNLQTDPLNGMDFNEAGSFMGLD